MQTLVVTREFYDTIDLIITPVIIADNSTICQYVNKAFTNQIGYRPEDIPDQPAWFNIAYKDEAYRNEVRNNWIKRIDAAKTKNETHAHMVSKIDCADGTSKWFDIHESIY